jgi:hypothetical protein
LGAAPGPGDPDPEIEALSERGSKLIEVWVNYYTGMLHFVATTPVTILWAIVYGM